MYARAYIQYRLYRRTLALGACETRFIDIALITQAHALRQAAASCAMEDGVAGPSRTYVDVGARQNMRVRIPSS